MTKSGVLAAAAVLASALASPAMAQEVIYNPGYCAQFYPNANCQNKGPGSPYYGGYGGSYQRQVYPDQVYRDQAYRDRTWQGSTWQGSTWQGSTWQGSNWRGSYNRFDDNSGFWPGDVAAGAVGTAPGIAAAPIGGEAYARRNGFVCTPGTWFRGADGRRHLCQ